jgi:SAM-dependent methyltransferase
MNSIAPKIASETNDPGRRLNPRMIDSDWLVMRGMAKAIGALAAKVARPGAVAIDFGCGTAPYRPYFVAAGCRYLGADFEGAPDIAIDAAGLLAAGDASADLLLSFQVLEHVRDLAVYFSEARRVLRPAGRMVLSTHGTWLYHPHPEDHRRWTRQGLVAEIEGHGFEVTDCIAVVGPLGWTTVLRLTCFCHVLRKIPLAGPPLAGALCLVMNLRALLEEAVTPAAVTADNACVYVTLSRPRTAGEERC